jgi:D-glycero-alpha-D-manno-heptose 1-phosphate guanylyltransferase
MKECIILAGGMGTRLQSAVSNVPKCLAPTGGKPFLAHLLSYIIAEGFQHLVFSLGYKSEAVREWLKDFPFTSAISVDLVVEDKPLGTGGAIINSLPVLKGERFFVFNADTFFNINTQAMWNTFSARSARILVALKPMRQFSRYGSVETDDYGHLTAFKEKRYCDQGLINGGIYLIDREFLSSREYPEVFSFEKEILEKEAGKGTLSAYIENGLPQGYFIDIGVPEDYYKANEIFKYN